MRAFTVAPGMRGDTERSVEAIVKHVAELRSVFEAKGLPLEGGPTYVLVFSPDDSLNEVVSTILNTKRPAKKSA